MYNSPNISPPNVCSGQLSFTAHGLLNVVPLWRLGALDVRRPIYQLQLTDIQVGYSRLQPLHVAISGGDDERA